MITHESLSTAPKNIYTSISMPLRSVRGIFVLWFKCLQFTAQCNKVIIHSDCLQIAIIENISGCTMTQKIRIPQWNCDKALFVVVFQRLKVVNIRAEILDLCHLLRIPVWSHPCWRFRLWLDTEETQRRQMRQGSHDCRLKQVPSCLLRKGHGTILRAVSFPKVHTLLALKLCFHPPALLCPVSTLLFCSLVFNTSTLAILPIDFS